tara:strand:- start:8889 stop:9116 length:228 start_codon:yes stop_codon:yes gene_type:complete
MTILEKINKKASALGINEEDLEGVFGLVVDSFILVAEHTKVTEPYATASIISLKTTANEVDMFLHDETLNDELEG